LTEETIIDKNEEGPSAGPTSVGDSAENNAEDGQDLSTQDEELESVAKEEIDSEESEPSYSDLVQKIIDVEAEAAEYLDGWQRSRAEFANARKRLDRDRIEARARVSADFAAKILPVFDDFERALENVPPEIEGNSWFEGLLLVNRKLTLLLEEMSVETIDAVGQPFDPNIHEALSLKEVEGVESGIVVEELQTGYRLGDRIIRPSLVNVAA
jgi:molecular chaperone GrpE